MKNAGPINQPALLRLTTLRVSSMSPLLQRAVPHPRANHRPRSPETSPIIIILQARFVHSVRLDVLDLVLMGKKSSVEP